MQTYASWWNTSTHSYSKRFKIQSLRSTLRRRQQILTRSVTRNSFKTTSIPSSRSGHTQRRIPDIKHLSFRNRFQRCTESCPPRANHLPATSSSSTTSTCRDSRRIQDTWELSRVASWPVSSRHCMLLLVLGSRCREQKTRVWYRLLAVHRWTETRHPHHFESSSIVWRHAKVQDRFRVDANSYFSTDASDDAIECKLASPQDPYSPERNTMMFNRVEFDNNARQERQTLTTSDQSLNDCGSIRVNTFDGSGTRIMSTSESLWDLRVLVRQLSMTRSISDHEHDVPLWQTSRVVILIAISRLKVIGIPWTWPCVMHQLSPRQWSKPFPTNIKRKIPP